jgi:serine/threonine-protein kinase HSL1 (negative regulator of Swe1 kinase)
MISKYFPRISIMGIIKLINRRPNDQKLFYSLLLKHQEQQLENYTPDVAYSSSDYHHVRPLRQVKKLSTRQFSQPNANGVGRKISRFTIVSHASKTSHKRNNSDYAETDAGETVKSYDPFKASRPQHLAPITAASRSNIIVHRSHASEQGDTAERYNKLLSRVKLNSSTPAGANGGSLVPPPRAFQSRSSLASSTRSRESNGKVKPANHKRGVSFSHGRRSNNRLSVEENVPESNLRYSITAEGDPGMACSSPQLQNTGRYIRSRKAIGATSQPLLNGKSLRKANRASYIFQEDVRQLSNSLAKDCDEAFNRTSRLSTIESENSMDLESPGTGYSALGSSSANARTDLSLVAPPKLPMVIRGKPWDNRPLPPPPDRTDSIQLELAEAQRQAYLRRLSGNSIHSPRYLDKMVDHIDRLVLPSPSTEHYRGKKRAVSEPLDMKSRDFGHALPAIFESSAGDEIDYDEYNAFIRMEHLKNSANPTGLGQQAHKRSDYANEWETFTARGVPTSPARAPAPLNIRKNSRGRESECPPMTSRPPRFSQASRNSSGAPSFDFSEKTSNTSKTSYRQATTSGDDSFVSDEANGLSRKKNWFRRSEKSVEEKGIPTEIFESAPAPYSNNNSAPTNRKKGFGFGNIFKRRSTKQADMSVGDGKAPGELRVIVVLTMSCRL